MLSKHRRRWQLADRRNPPTRSLPQSHGRPSATYTYSRSCYIIIYFSSSLFPPPTLYIVYIFSGSLPLTMGPDVLCRRLVWLYAPSPSLLPPSSSLSSFPLHHQSQNKWRENHRLLPPSPPAVFDGRPVMSDGNNGHTARWNDGRAGKTSACVIKLNGPHK